MRQNPLRHGERTKSTAGFSLIELLIVVAIILIIAAIAIPNLLRARRSANEASATASMRTIGSGQLLYRSTNGNFTSLTGLSQDSVIDGVLGSGAKSGYTFVSAAGANSTLQFTAISAPTKIRCPTPTLRSTPSTSGRATKIITPVATG